MLRELVRHGGALAAPALAERAGLSRQHVLRVLDGLVELGIVETLGVGAHPAYRARGEHPLHPPLAALFQAEEARFSRVAEAIRVAAREAEAVWLYGSVARGDDTAASDVDIAVVIGGGEVERTADEVRARLAPVEEALGIRVSVVGLDTEDVLRLSEGDPWWRSVAEEAVALAGPDPERLAARLRRRAAGTQPDRGL